MDFDQLEKFMQERGIESLASIARSLNTTPQAVSNWKSRGQVPHHVIAKLNIIKYNRSIGNDSERTEILYSSNSNIQDNTISLSDFLLVVAEQFKVIIFTTFLTTFAAFTYTWSTDKTFYESSAKILLPETKKNQSGIANLASQFGVNAPQAPTLDLSSPSLFPQLIKSFSFAELIMEEKFYVEKFGKELSLLAILTHGNEQPKVGKDTLIKSAMSSFEKMVELKNDGPLSLLTVRASEPKLARDINLNVIEKLQSLNRQYKSQNVSERISFINSRIEVVKKELNYSEGVLKDFREKNRQIISPSLLLEQERLSREVEVQKGVFLTLKQQLELANIEKIQSETIIQILDKPQIPLSGISANLKFIGLISSIAGLGLGLLFAFLRSYFNNDSAIEKKKIKKIKHFIRKKSKELLLDYRVTGTLSFILFLGLPFYLGSESQDPEYFGRYSLKLMLINSLYVLSFFILIVFFLYSKKSKKK